jgi:hypothetical protein
LMLVFNLEALSFSVFSPTSRVIAAVCLASLSVLGLLDLFAKHHGGGSEIPANAPVIRAMLVPYVVLASAVILLLILAAIRKMFAKLRRADKDRKRADDPVVREESAPGRWNNRQG